MEYSRICKNCETRFVGQYCPECGQKHIAERWNLKRLLRSAFTAVINLEKGFFYTFKNMIWRPGGVINDYLNGKTIRYTNPFRYAILAIGLSVFLSLTLGVWSSQTEVVIDTYKEIGLVDSEESEQRMRTSFEMVSKVLNFIPLLLFPFIAWSTRLFYKKHGLYYAEHFIMVAFVTGQVTLYGIVIILASALLPTATSFIMPISFLITAFVYGQVFQVLFNVKKLEGFLMGFLAYLLSFFTFLLTLTILGVLIAIPATLIYLKIKG